MGAEKEFLPNLQDLPASKRAKMDKDVAIQNNEKASKIHKRDNKNMEIANKNKEIASKSKKTTKKNQEIAKKDKEIAKKDKEIARKNQEIATNVEEISRKNNEISCLRQMLDEQKNQIAGLKREIWRLKPNGDEMDEILLRFPHLGQQIFEKLDSNMLARCVEVKRQWKTFLNEEKLPIISTTALKQVLRKRDLKKLDREVQVVYDKYGKMWPGRSYGLHTAAEYGHLAICQLIIEKDGSEETALSALRFAAKNGYLDVCKLLIESGAEKHPRNNSGETPLEMAMELKYFNVAAFLLQFEPFFM